jgi:thiamine kinase-like enzyme
MSSSHIKELTLDSLYNSKKIYELPKPTNTWLVNKIIEKSSEGYIILAKLHEKEKVIIKLSLDSKNEYNIYKLIERLPIIPTIPKLIGTLSCYELKTNLEDLSKLKDQGLCHGQKDSESIKIYLSIMERIKDCVKLDKILTLSLTTLQIISILIQGLYTIYSLYYVFGILHNDFNVGNILLKKCDESKKITFKFNSHPYRHFDYEIKHNSDELYRDDIIDTYGVRLYLIDFDQATIIHQKYINTDNITKHPIESAKEFLLAIVNSINSTELKDIIMEHYDTRGKHLISFSKKFLDKYISEPTEHNCNFLIDRNRVYYKMWLKEFFLKFDGLKRKYYGDFC